MPVLRKAPTTADCTGKILALRQGSAEIDPKSADELRRALAAGGYIDRLQVDALTFLQTDAPNRNYVRFSTRALQRMAKSFVGRPFLADHERDITKRGGTIVASELVDVDGGRGLRQTFDLVKPWAQLGILDGTITEFSIGWYPKLATEPLCTVCEKPMFSLDCNHFPGDVVTPKNGAPKTVEMLFTDADGVETSGVTVPAVAGTGIEGVRAALSEFRIDPQQVTRLRANGKPKETSMSAELATLLGLSADAETPTILAAARTLKTERDAAVAQQKQTADALAVAQKKIDEVEAAARVTRLSALIDAAYRAGKIAGVAGEKNDVEKSLRALAAIDISSAETFIAAMPRVVPVGTSLQSGQAEPPETRKPGELSEAEKKVCAQMGVTHERYLKEKADYYAAKDKE